MVNRISIIGGCGSGKSTLADLLSKELNIPAIHLDAINFNENWEEVETQKRDSIILSKTNDEKWIIDGNYRATLQDRLDKADLIIWLDYSTPALVKGVMKRVIKNYHKERKEIPGCKERFSLSFLKYAAGYNKNKRPKIKEFMDKVPSEKVMIFRKQKDLNKWLKEYTHNDKILDNI